MRQLATAITQGILFMSAAIGTMGVGVVVHIATSSELAADLAAVVWGLACISGIILPELAHGRDSKPRK